MEWIRLGNKMETLRHYSLFPRAEKNVSCFVWKKKPLTGIATSGVINVFQDAFLREGEGY
jgi:hypothetical protein